MNKTILLLLPLIALIACQQTETAAPAQQAAGSSAADPHANTDPSAVGAVEAMSNAGSLDSADVRYDLPDGWSRELPTSSMRLDQATIPGQAGDGHLTVFFFGVGGGGGVNANLERWAAQVQHEAPPTRELFEVNGYRVSMIEVEGTLLPSGMGAGPTEPQPGSVLLGAVVEGTGGPWFFKATGPKETMAEHRDDFVAMLKSIRANL